jgi:hypothetical protein
MEALETVWADRQHSRVDEVSCAWLAAWWMLPLEACSVGSAVLECGVCFFVWLCLYLLCW